MASTVPMPAETVVSTSQAERIRLHNLHDRIKDEHKARFCNHVIMLCISSLLIGFASGWEIRDLMISGSLAFPTLMMEIFDYIARL